MEDRRAHERIDDVKTVLDKHLEDHRKFEDALAENTHLTKTIASNTSELVELVRGAKGLRSFIIWAAPIAAFIAAMVAYIRNVK